MLPSLNILARALEQKNKISKKQVQLCSEQSDTSPNSFIFALVRQKLLTFSEIAQFISSTFGFPLLDLDQVDDTYINKALIDPKIIQRYQILPLAKHPNSFCIAIADAANIQVLDEIRFQLNIKISPIIVEADKLQQKIAHFIESNAQTINDIVGEGDISQSFDHSKKSKQKTNIGQNDIDDAPVVKFIQKVLLDAINEEASDIHFEPYEKYYRIRVRIDGSLREIAHPPLELREQIASRIKVISNMDISEKRIPQDGRMKLDLSKNKSIDFRVSSLPTLHGEKIVMRILNATSAMLGIESLGYEPDQQKLILDAIKRPYGMVLATGPTGSGKTVSLYTCLNILNQINCNISTIEDPAEINLAGINQVNVNEKTGLTFATALRAFLRQDPDIIMVGEIRDLETAEIAIKAAQTGHMLLSTLHTNDAPTTIERLRNMGIAPFNIASSVILITAQRLARKLCPHCKKPVNIPFEALLSAGFTPEDLNGMWQTYVPVGCNHCKESGYKGRIGIHQVMPISEAIAHIIMTNGNSEDIAKQAQREGISNLRQSGLLKVKSGITSLEEVLALTNE